VIYSGTATEAQATALGNALKADGYFSDRGVSVLLNMAPAAPRFRSLSRMVIGTSPGPWGSSKKSDGKWLPRSAVFP